MGMLQKLASGKDNCVLFGNGTLEHVVQRAGRYRIPGGILGQVGQSSEQSDLVEGVCHYRTRNE